MVYGHVCEVASRGREARANAQYVYFFGRAMLGLSLPLRDLMVIVREQASSEDKKREVLRAGLLSVPRMRCVETGEETKNKGVNSIIICFRVHCRVCFRVYYYTISRCVMPIEL